MWLWLLIPFIKKVRRTMRTAIVSYLLKVLYGDSINKPLAVILKKNCFNVKNIFKWQGKRKCSNNWQKNDKQILTNYRPVPLLSICGKIFQRIIYNKIYNYGKKNNLLSPNQSVFDTLDSFINQLLPITHDIYCSFDKGTRAIFLDISKVFDKIWHKRLVYELCQYGF